MAAASSRGRSELQSSKEMERENAQNANFGNNAGARVVVPVVYYLSRNGQLQHPHFMEVPLSSPHGLFLRDIISRLNLLRGKGIAYQYSWSSKRSYKNGYVWHDLEENDFIHPVHGGEYVLKGSEILETVSKSPDTSSSCSVKITPEFPTAGRIRRRNQSLGAIDLHEYKVYKAESTREMSGAADASTQTDEKRRRRSRAPIKEETEGEGNETVEQSTELSREEISPPPLDSSPETLESLIKADGRLIIAPLSSSSSSSATSLQAVDQTKGANQTAGYCPSGRMKASSVIMSLISCGSVAFRDCGAVAVKEHGMSLVSHHKTRTTRGENRTVGGKEGEMIKNDDVMGETEERISSGFARMALEDKEYFSGSLLMEANKDESPSLKLNRSSSYNADRSLRFKMVEKEEEGVRARCMPRRPRTTQANSTRKEYGAEITSVAINKSTQNGS